MLSGFELYPRWVPLNSRCFKIYRAYSISFNLSNVDKFLWSWILRIVSKFGKRKRKLLFCVPVLTPQNVKLVVVVAWISSDHFESLLLPQLRGENDSKQSDEFQAIVVVQRRLRNVPKTVIRVQNCYFANLNMSKLITFFADLVADAVIAPYEHVTREKVGVSKHLTREWSASTVS